MPDRIQINVPLSLPRQQSGTPLPTWDLRPGPRRIQLHRTAGWRKPEGAVVVARPTKWGNPWRVGDAATCRFPGGEERPIILDHDLAVVLFRQTLLRGDLPITVEAVHAALSGRDLACWCRLDQPCHADVLLELANATVNA